MKTYDGIVGFDYTNIGEWEDFVKKQILPLNKSISKLVGLREYLENRINGDSLPDLIKNDTSVRQILLGGINEEGEYKPNSLAKMYKEMIGVSIDPKEWGICCKQKGIDASRYVKCNFSDTVFLQFITALEEYTDKLLPLARIDSTGVTEVEIKEIFENPEKIADELKAIYTYIINISVNHNYHTFLILNTRCIPRGYIEQAYPKLKDDFDKLAEFLALEPKFVPEIEEESVRKDYTLWGHKENGFADLVYGLNRTVFEYLEKEEFIGTIELIISGTRNLRQEYSEKVRTALDRISWKIPEYIQATSDPNYEHSYKIVGPMLTEHVLRVYTRENHPWDELRNRCPTVKPRWLTKSRECEVSLLKLLDDLSALLLLSEPENQYSLGIEVEVKENMVKIYGEVKEKYKNIIEIS